MVASLLRLRLLGLANRLVRPRSRAEQITALLALFAGIAAIIGIVLLGEFARATTEELRHAAFVTVGSLTVAAFWLVPLVVRTTGGIEPRAFAHLPVRPGRLAGGIAVASLLSIPMLLLVGLLVAYVATWAASGAEIALLAAVSGLLVIAMAVLGSLVAANLARDSIGLRNATGTIAMAILAIGVPVLALVDWGAVGLTYLRRSAAALSGAPFGLPWSIPGDAAAGRTDQAWLHVAFSALVIALLWLGWALLVRYQLTRRLRVAETQLRGRLGAFDLMPDSQAGVVAARSVTYWLRDPRYIVPILILPLVPAGIIAAFWLAGIDWSIIVWFPVPIVSLIIGWSVHNDVAADGTAFWLHVVTSVRGRADRWGRLLVPIAIGLPVAVLGSVASAVMYGDDSIAAPLISLSVCALFAGLGVGSVASAVAPYPTVQPGDSPFQQPQGNGGAGLQQVGSMLLAVVACLPATLAIIAARASGSDDYMTAVTLGLVIGPLVLLVGVELGAFAMRRRAPEILAFTQQN